MQIKQIYQSAFALLRSYPYLLIVAIIGVVADIYAILIFSETSTQMQSGLFLAAVITILGEVGLTYAIGQHFIGKQSSFIDATVTAFTYFFQVLAVKIFPFLILAALAMVLIIFSSAASLALRSLTSSAIQFGVGAIFVILATAVLTLTQLWTFFGIAAIVIRNTSDFFAHAWQTLWKNLGQILRVAWPILAIDLLLIGSMLLFGIITYESTFEYTVTLEMADRNTILGTGQTAPGTYTSINRLISSAMSTALKVRGLDLLSLAIPVIGNRTAGILIIFISALLLYLRTAVLTVIYLTLTGPLKTLQPHLRPLQR